MVYIPFSLVSLQKAIRLNQKLPTCSHCAAVLSHVKVGRSIDQALHTRRSFQFLQSGFILLNLKPINSGDHLGVSWESDDFFMVTLGSLHGKVTKEFHGFGNQGIKFDGSCQWFTPLRSLRSKGFFPNLQCTKASVSIQFRTALDPRLTVQGAKKWQVTHMDVIYPSSMGGEQFGESLGIRLSKCFITLCGLSLIEVISYNLPKVISTKPTNQYPTPEGSTSNDWTIIYKSWFTSWYGQWWENPASTGL